MENTESTDAALTNEAVQATNLGREVIVFDVTASTNFPASRISLHRDGEVYIGTGAPAKGPELDGQNHFRLAQPVVDHIFEELEKVWPIHPSQPTVVKSVSFGCNSYITYAGERSPDLDTCMSNLAVKQLRSDLNALRKAR